jgi:hypothetical protein
MRHDAAHAEQQDVGFEVGGVGEQAFGVQAAIGLAQVGLNSAHRLAHPPPLLGG